MGNAFSGPSVKPNPKAESDGESSVDGSNASTPNQLRAGDVIGVSPNKLRAGDSPRGIRRMNSNGVPLDGTMVAATPPKHRPTAKQRRGSIWGGKKTAEQHTEIVYVIGGSGVGKSTYIQMHMNFHVVIDPDKIRGLCPHDDPDPDGKGSITYKWTKTRARRTNRARKARRCSRAQRRTPPLTHKRSTSRWALQAARSYLRRQSCERRASTLATVLALLPRPATSWPTGAPSYTALDYAASPRQRRARSLRSRPPALGRLFIHHTSMHSHLRRLRRKYAVRLLSVAQPRPTPRRYAVPGTGKSTARENLNSHMATIMIRAKAAGFHTKLVYLNATPEMALKRNKMRARALPESVSARPSYTTATLSWRLHSVAAGPIPAHSQRRPLTSSHDNNPSLCLTDRA